MLRKFSYQKSEGVLLNEDQKSEREREKEEKLGKEWYQEVNKQPTILSQIVYSESDPIVMKNNTLSMKNSMKKYYHHLISDS